MPKTESTTQISAAIETCKAVYEAIAAMGDDGMISGHLYAALMGTLTLSQYESILRVLTNAGLISCTNHVLRAVKH